jgi:colanic acid/amylovoran biosynthesis glycosyltransferase
MSAAAKESISVQDDEDARGLRVAFVLGIFPLVSETFIIDQIAQLVDRGVEVDILSMSRGDEANVSRAYFDYAMSSRVEYLDYPLPWLRRLRGAWGPAFRLARRHPRVLLRAINVFKHGRWALSLKLLYWSEPIAGRSYDVVHCHFGNVAHDFVRVRDVTMIEAPLVTTFYGVDVSRLIRDKPPDYYDELKNVGAFFFVMSQDMRRRVIEHGFPAEKVFVNPVSIALSDYPFAVPSLGEGEALHLVSVGRLVETKGFDDLLRALAIAKERSSRALRCTVVGGGPLDAELRTLSDELALQEVVDFQGPMPLEDVIDLLAGAHVFVQPSKTGRDGDME